MPYIRESHERGLREKANLLVMSPKKAKKQLRKESKMIIFKSVSESIRCLAVSVKKTTVWRKNFNMSNM
jgi:hypothetical protein